MIILSMPLVVSKSLAFAFLTFWLPMIPLIFLFYYIAYRYAIYGIVLDWFQSYLSSSVLCQTFT